MFAQLDLVHVHICVHVCMFSRLHLVWPFMYDCLPHFPATDWFKLNCLPCSYHIPSWMHTHAHTHESLSLTHAQYKSCCVLFNLPTSNRNTFFISWMSEIEKPLSVCLDSCACLHIFMQYLQRGEWTKTTKSIRGDVRNLVLTQVTGERMRLL